MQSGEHHAAIPTAFRCWEQNVLDQMKRRPEVFGEAEALLGGSGLLGAAELRRGDTGAAGESLHRRLALGSSRS